MRQKTVQNAGRAFFDAFEQSGAHIDSESGDADTAESDHESAEDKSPSKNKKKKEKKENDNALKLSDVLKGQDLYALLELDAGASQDDLRKSYRKMCLVHHPDKQDQDVSPEEKEARNVRFLQLQEAFEVLNDPKKRRKYDSLGEFDDSFPKGLKKGQDFFEVFRPVFRRNAKWSEKKPVPDLGDEETPYDKVRAFYEFWRGFSSWRDLDEKIKEELSDEECFHDLQEAECREERRWMERENARLRGKFMKVERQRVLDLVEVAEKNDPRIKAEKARLAAVREAAKAEKEALKAEKERAAREEEERRAALERQAEKVRQAEKAQKEEEKQAKKLLRAKLRKQIQALNLGIVEEQLQDFLLAMQPTEIESLSESLAAEAKGEAVFAAMESKGFQAIIVKVQPDEISTAASEGADEEQEQAETEEQRKARLAEERKKAAKRKKEEEAQAAKRKEEEEQQRQLREAEAARRAEEKAVRDAKKKADAEKREKERLRADKKEAERLKREEEKQQREEAKAAEKAQLDREAQARRLEEQREKQRLEREQAEQARLAEAAMIAFEKDRMQRLEALEKLEWSAVSAVGQACAANPLIAAALLAAESRAGGDAEELIDGRLACLGSFFVLGVRPHPEAPQLTPAIRNRAKKYRAKLRAIAVGELFSETLQGVADEAAFDQLMRVAQWGAEAAEKAPEMLPKGPATDATAYIVDIADGAYGADGIPVFEAPTSSNIVRRVRQGGTVHASGPETIVDGYPMLPILPSGAVESAHVRRQQAAAAAAVPVAEAPAAEAQAAPAPEDAKKKTKAKTGTPDQEEDLDALLEEFGVEVKAGAKKTKGKGNKKK